jgi:hypothetical protein
LAAFGEGATPASEALAYECGAVSAESSFFGS